MKLVAVGFGKALKEIFKILGNNFLAVELGNVPLLDQRPTKASSWERQTSLTGGYDGASWIGK